MTIDTDEKSRKHVRGGTPENRHRGRRLHVVIVLFMYARRFHLSNVVIYPFT